MIKILPPLHSTMLVTRKMHAYAETQRLVWQTLASPDLANPPHAAEGYTGASDIEYNLVEASSYIDIAVQMLKDMQMQHKGKTPAEILCMNPSICLTLDEQYMSPTRR
jgi:hypothetical protein